MKKNHPDFDPRELDDLILTPAVGTGVGSHLIGQAPHSAIQSRHKTTEASSYKSIVVSNYETTMAMMWVTEAGDLIPASRVKPIRVPQDILNAAELAVYESSLESCGGGSTGTQPAGAGRVSSADEEHASFQENHSKGD